MRGFLAQHTEPRWSSEKLEERVALAAGSIGAALSEGEEVGKAYRAAEQLLEAVVDGPRRRARAGAGPGAVRGPRRVRRDARRAGGHAGRGGARHAGTAGPPAGARRRCCATGAPAPLLHAMEQVAEAREAAAGNVNPQILLAVLGEELAEVL